MEQTKYDVFISYSRKDYVKDDVEIPNNPVSAIMDFFDQNGVSYWVDKKGIYSGQQFLEVITEAINNSSMLVFISSKNSNESKWTVNEIFEAYEEEKLIIPFKIDDTPYNRKFRIIVRPFDYIDYGNHPNTALQDLLRAVNNEKDVLKRKTIEIEEQKRKEIIKQEIASGIKEFQGLTGQSDFLLRTLYAKSKDVGSKTKKCPICESEIPLDSSFCTSCGWHFSSLYGIYGVEGQSLHDEKQVTIARNLLKRAEEGKKSIARLHEISEILKEEQRKNQNFLNEIHERDSRVAQLNSERNALLQENERRKVELEKEVATKDKLIHDLKRQLTDAEEKFKKVINQQLAENKRLEEATKAVRTFTVGGVSFNMIRVEGGRFQMGASEKDTDAYSDEKPQHWVNLSDYYMGETIVTQALWKAVMGTNPSAFKGDNNPVEQVSWNDCQEFIKKLNEKTGQTFRLPTEAEWEYAARDGNKSKGYKYAGSNHAEEVAWFEDNSGEKTHPVKTKKPNELGLFDMSGNVCEWCQDWYGDYSNSEQTNPNGALSGSARVNRGGSWYRGAWRCRVSDRNGCAPSDTHYDFGFRLAL